MTEPGFTFVPAERTVELFLHSVGRLQVNDDGLAWGHDIADLNACAFMCHMMKALAIVPRDPLDVLLFNLAHETEQLITTAVLAADGDVATRWSRARAAVLECQLGAL